MDRIDLDRQRHWAITYVEQRYDGAVEVLDQARRGKLDVDWRGRRMKCALARRTPVAVMQPYLDVEVLVAHELASWSRRTWEPFAAQGDWRAALEAWYEDRLAVEASHEDFARQRLVSLRWAKTESGWWHQQQRTRDRVEALYRAGLASGGDPVDWIGWFRQRIELREETDPWRIRGRERVLATLDETRQEMEFLPSYWRQTTP